MAAASLLAVFSSRPGACGRPRPVAPGARKVVNYSAHPGDPLARGSLRNNWSILRQQRSVSTAAVPPAGPQRRPIRMGTPPLSRGEGSEALGAGGARIPIWRSVRRFWIFAFGFWIRRAGAGPLSYSAFHIPHSLFMPGPPSRRRGVENECGMRNAECRVRNERPPCENRGAVSATPARAKSASSASAAGSPLEGALRSEQLPELFSASAHTNGRRLGRRAHLFSGAPAAARRNRVAGRRQPPVLRCPPNPSRNAATWKCPPTRSAAHAWGWKKGIP